MKKNKIFLTFVVLLLLIPITCLILLFIKLFTGFNNNLVNNDHTVSGLYYAAIIVTSIIGCFIPISIHKYNIDKNKREDKKEMTQATDRAINQYNKIINSSDFKFFYNLQDKILNNFNIKKDVENKTEKDTFIASLKGIKKQELLDYIVLIIEIQKEASDKTIEPNELEYEVYEKDLNDYFYIFNEKLIIINSICRSYVNQLIEENVFYSRMFPIFLEMYYFMLMLNYFKCVAFSTDLAGAIISVLEMERGKNEKRKRCKDK